MNQHGTAFKAQSLDFLYLHAPCCFRWDERGEAISVCYSYQVAIALIWESFSSCVHSAAVVTGR